MAQILALLWVWALVGEGCEAALGRWDNSDIIFVRIQTQTWLRDLGGGLLRTLS